MVLLWRWNSEISCGFIATNILEIQNKKSWKNDYKVKDQMPTKNNKKMFVSFP